jgi:hypothetical protein
MSYKIARPYRAVIRCLATALVVWASAIGFVTADARASAVDEFLGRVKATAWPYKSLTNPPARIKHDDKGKVVELRLDGVNLKPGDLELICSMKELVELNLCQTNIKDEQIEKLSALPHLRGLQLNHTAIGDEAIKYLAKLPALESLCLGGVKVTRAGLKSLHTAKPELAVGYFPEHK